jgi:hypothetical protein
LAVLTASFLVVMQPVEAKSENRPRKIGLVYEIYARGLKLMDLRISILLSGNKYLIKSRLKTTGVANLFSSLSARYEATGRLSALAASPARFQMLIEKSSKKRAANVAWIKGGKYTIRQRPPLSASKAAAVARVMRPGLPDPLSMLVEFAFTRSTRPCRLARRIFDGRKIFDLSVSPAGAVKLEKSDYDLYQGAAIKCMVHDRPIAGYSRKKLKRYRDDPPKPLTVWAVPVNSVVVGRPMLVPVKIAGEASWTRISAQLRKVEIDGRQHKRFFLAGAGR